MTRLTQSAQLSVAIAGAASLWLATRGSDAQEPPTSSTRDNDDASVVGGWFGPSVGYSYVRLRTFTASNEDDNFSAGLLPTDAWGPTVGLGGGVRILVFDLGLRASVTFLDEDDTALAVDRFHLWDVGLELGVRAPFGRVDAYGMLLAGYSTFGGMGDALGEIKRGLDVNGAHAGAAIGVDYAIGNFGFLGVRLEGLALFLARDNVSVRDVLEPQQVDTISDAQARILEVDDTSVGASATLFLVGGLNFGRGS